jgi:hypothetical protein
MRLLLLASLVTVAAAIAAPARAQDDNPPDPSIADGSAHRALDRAKARWRDAAIRSYRFDVRVECFCPDVQWHAVVVRDRRPSSRTPREVREVATVPRLHRAIRRAIAARVHRLDVSYSRHGVPRRIAIDENPRIADEEVTYRTRRFRRG